MICLLAQAAPDQADGGAIAKLLGSPVLLGVLVLIVIGVVVVLGRVLLGRKGKDPEAGLREDLAEYPPAPRLPANAWQLVYQGEPVRVRLVVVAPVGKNKIDLDEVPEMLDGVVRGFSEVISTDKPRVRVWPTPLSVTGFAQYFQRLIDYPSDADEAAHWITVAGPVKAGPRQFVLGLALYADEPTPLGRAALQAEEWKANLQLERA
jgi:hypothetical protein